MILPKNLGVKCDTPKTNLNKKTYPVNISQKIYSIYCFGWYKLSDLMECALLYVSFIPEKFFEGFLNFGNFTC